MDDDQDQADLAAYRRGDREAFARLVVRYQRPVYNAALWILHRPEDAGDVTQAAFLKVVERLDDYDPTHRFFSWLYRIAVNEAIDVQRRRGRSEPLDDLDDTVAESRPGPEEQAGRTEETRRLRRCLQRLSVKDRTVITLRHFSELSYDEIAHVLDLDEKTVRSRLFDARRRLRGLMTDLEVT